MRKYPNHYLDPLWHVRPAKTLWNKWNIQREYLWKKVEKLMRGNSTSIVLELRKNQQVNINVKWQLRKFKLCPVWGRVKGLLAQWRAQHQQRQCSLAKRQLQVSTNKLPTTKYGYLCSNSNQNMDYFIV